MHAGGQNMNLSMFTNLKQISHRKLCGIMMFSHFWYWYPFLQYLSISFDTSEIYLLNTELSIINTQIKTSASKDARAYVKRFKQARSAEADRVHSAVLSLAKNKSRFLSSGRRKIAITINPPSSSTSAAPISSSSKHGPSSAKKEKISSSKTSSDSSKSPSTSKNKTKELKSPAEKSPASQAPCNF